jgi:hypothetical protein
MATAKELKSNPKFNVNMFELFSLICPEKKTKYTETLLRIMEKTPNLDDHCDEIKDYLNKELKIDKEELNNIPKLQLIFFYRILDSVFNLPDLKLYQQFCEYNERGLIKQNDLSTYQSFEDITKSVSVAEILANNKDLEKQIEIVYEDQEWLMILPLTYNSSKKYGSNTKWCTTTENNPEYFVKYSSKGVLVYCINKKNGYKVASFRSLDKSDPEFSFWDQKDSRIDSLQTELPDELLKIIRDISTKNPKTNRSRLSPDELSMENAHLNKLGYVNTYPTEPVNIDVGNERRMEYINRAIERRYEDEVGENPVMSEGISPEDGDLINISRLVDINQGYEDNTQEDRPNSAW